MASISLPRPRQLPGGWFLLRLAGFNDSFGPVQIATILCLWGLVIGAVYMLRAYRNIFQGDLSKAAATPRNCRSERAANYFLTITLAVFGFSPRWCSSLLLIPLPNTTKFNPIFLLPMQAYIPEFILAGLAMLVYGRGPSAKDALN